MSRLARSCLVSLLVSLSGCHALTFDLVDAPHVSVVTERNAFFFGGLFPRRHGDALARCPHGVAKIREETTFGDGVISLLTLGVYTPRTSHYHCLAAPGDAR
jgi:hypothetical protein